MTALKNACLFLLLLGSVGVVSADPDVRLVVGDVNDERTTGSSFAKLEVTLKLIGDDVASATFLHTTITSAKDSLGRELVDPARIENSYQNKDSGSLPTVKLVLKNPSRKATEIASIQGVIKLFVPENDPESVIKVPEFIRHAGSPFTEPVLKVNDIEITYWTKEIAKAEKEKRDAKKAENDMAASLSAAFGSMFQDIFGSRENEATFQISDPENRIVKIDMQNGAEKSIFSGSTTTRKRDDYRIVSYGLVEPLTDKTLLVISVATDKALLKVPIILKDIVLP